MHGRTFFRIMFDLIGPNNSRISILNDKLKEFLPSHNVTICFPIAQNKIIRLYDKCGSLVKESKSNI